MRALGKVTAGSYIYSVYELKGEEELAALGHAAADGATVPTELRIYVVSEDEESRFLDTFVHELQHAIMEASGLGPWLGRRVGKSGDDLDLLLEDFISIYTPHLIATLQSAGLMARAWRRRRRAKR